MAHVPEELVETGTSLFYLLVVGCEEDGTVEFAVNDSGRFGSDGEISFDTSWDDGRIRVVGKSNQQTNVVLDVLPEDGEDGIQNVALCGSQSTVAGSGHKTSGVNLLNSNLFLRQKPVDRVGYFLVSLNASGVSVSRSVDDGDGVRNGHSFLVVDGVGRHGAGLTVRLIPVAGFVFADALEAERILPLDTEDVVDHPVDQRTLPASCGAHQDDDFMLPSVVRRADVKPAKVSIGIFLCV